MRHPNPLPAEVAQCTDLILFHCSSANGLQQKMYNWNTLNAKVFKRLGFMATKQDCEACCNCKPGAVERVLKLIKVKIAKYKEEHGWVRWCQRLCNNSFRTP